MNASSPAISADGTIYVGSEDNNLYAINPDGSQKWKFTTNGFVDSSPAIGADGTVYVGSDDGNLYTVGAPVVLSRANLSFGAEFIGMTTVAQMVTLTNFQSVPLNISKLSASGDFHATSNCSSTVAATHSCAISVTFDPTAAYGRNGILTVQDDASNSPQTASLYGVGVPDGVPPWSGFPNSPFLTLEGVGSSGGALGYYQTIDPQNLRTTLGRWWALNGFDAATGAGGVRTAYLNNNDLGFGRDMHCNQLGTDVACYVTNYGPPNQDPNNANLALAANQSQAGATVAMEYRPIEGQSTSIVKFFVFNGGTARRSSCAIGESRRVRGKVCPPTLPQLSWRRLHSGELQPAHGRGSEHGFKFPGVRS